MIQRQRKTKQPCEGCRLRPALCICHLIPSLRLRTKVVLLVHAKELKRTTNTGRLAIRMLLNSEMRIRGEGKERLIVDDLLVPEYRSVLFFPTEDAIELTEEFVSQSQSPIQLIVPDGNWRQASKVVHRHPEFENLPRVKISRVNTAEHHLRQESSSVGMSTLEAIACALRVIEGESVFEKLLAVYRAKLEMTLIGRGIKKVTARAAVTP